MIVERLPRVSPSRIDDESVRAADSVRPAILCVAFPQPI